MGPLVSTHPVDLEHRRSLAQLALGGALLFLLPLIAMLFVDLDGLEYAGLLFLLPFTPLALIAALGLRPGARVPETYELHEGGIAQVKGGVRRSWTWERVQAVRMQTSGRPSGEVVRCSVQFDDGVTLGLGNSAADFPALLAALGEHCQEAIRRPLRPHSLRRSVLGLSAVTVVGAGVATWAVLRVFAVADETGGTQFGLAMLAVVSAVPAVFGAVLLVTTVVTNRR
ncbi:hypothetical protein PV646_19015 [Streptomyces sp. ID05-26A]|nr:hypothetical protein [Streptomyces sp. ID05-26A]